MHATLLSHPHLLPAFEGAITSYHLGTAEHSARVARLGAIIGAELGMVENDLEALRWAGLLHDLGKLSVSEAILTKDGPLDEAEWVEVRRHTTIGSTLLLTVSPRLAPIAAGVRAHHERWDGSGYPDGLEGEHIPLIGRILAVADVYDSVTHPRSYRPFAFSQSEALELLASERGSHFDGRIVDTFIELHADGRFDSQWLQQPAAANSRCW
jgi:putative nucleotidyltransferase with HDIG domain